MNRDIHKLDERLERIEAKLDKYLESISKHETDLGWIKSFIKGSTVALITLTSGLITAFIKMKT